MKNMNRVLSLDREDMNELDRQLYLKDISRVNGEYFECEGEPTLEITRADEGFLVCTIFTARRVKSVKRIG